MWGHLFVFQSFDGAYFSLLVSRSGWNLGQIFGKIWGMDLNMVKCVKWSWGIFLAKSIIIARIFNKTYKYVRVELHECCCFSSVEICSAFWGVLPPRKSCLKNWITKVIQFQIAPLSYFEFLWSVGPALLRWKAFIRLFMSDMSAEWTNKHVYLFVFM